MPNLSRYNLLGVGIHAVDYAMATDCIVSAARERRPFAATALAVHGVMTGHDDSEQGIRLNRLDLVTPDGQPVRWALNWLYRTGLGDRVYGPFLMLRVCERAAKEGLRVFLYGSDRATLEKLSSSLCRRFPGLLIAGVRPSRFRQATEEEWSEDVSVLREAKPDLIFCGLGCPRQEVWVYEMRRYLDCPLIAVGAAFTFWSGRVKMAPRWMQRFGLEWLYRFSREPVWLWRRYLFLNPRYLLGVFFQKLSASAASPDKGDDDPQDLRWS